jgi:hypothetical protein
MVLRTEYNGQAAKLATVSAMEELAKTIFDKHVDRPGKTYAGALPELAAAWPSNDTTVVDKQFYAMAWLTGVYPKNKVRT